MIAAGRQQNLAAEIRLSHAEPELALMLRQRAVRRVDEKEIRFARLQARLEDLLPEQTRRDGLERRVRERAAQSEGPVVAHSLHELVGDRDAVVEVQALAVEVPGGFADLDELLDLRMMHIEVDGRGAAAQRALRDRERERVHDADERDDARGLPVAFDGLADRAHAAPVRADAAAVRREPDVFGPGPD